MGAKNFQDPAVAKTPASTLAKIIANGKNKMPPYEGTLKPKEIKDLAKYIKEIK
jgi:mono/diheme cytochrome c family protein